MACWRQRNSYVHVPQSDRFRLQLTIPQDVSALVRPSSVEKPAVQALRDRKVDIRVVDINNDSVEAIAQKLSDVDTVISAIGPDAHLSQLRLVDAAKVAGVKRFVPCAFATVAPPGGVMALRDEVCILFLVYCVSGAQRLSKT